jgi:hypothetical protein
MIPPWFLDRVPTLPFGWLDWNWGKPQRMELPGLSAVPRR